MGKIEMYDAAEAAETIGISKIKLFKFLRRYSFISGTGEQLNVAPELLYNEYIILHETINYVGPFEKRLNQKKIYFTSKGLIWLKKIHPLLNP